MRVLVRHSTVQLNQPAVQILVNIKTVDAHRLFADIAFRDKVNSLGIYQD